MKTGGAVKSEAQGLNSERISEKDRFTGWVFKSTAIIAMPIAMFYKANNFLKETSVITNCDCGNCKTVFSTCFRVLHGLKLFCSDLDFSGHLFEVTSCLLNKDWNWSLDRTWRAGK